MTSFDKPELNILLADDDKDDCLLFTEALEELELQASLTLVHDGVQLMKLLNKHPSEKFDVLFLDLNMPRKNGFECLEEIKKNENLNSLPVIIISTSYNRIETDFLYDSGAMHYICKPSEFSELSKIIGEALLQVRGLNREQPSREKFQLRSLKVNSSMK